MIVFCLGRLGLVCLIRFGIKDIIDGGYFLVVGCLFKVRLILCWVWVIWVRLFIISRICLFWLWKYLVIVVVCCVVCRCSSGDWFVGIVIIYNFFVVLFCMMDWVKVLILCVCLLISLIIIMLVLVNFVIILIRIDLLMFDFVIILMCWFWLMFRMVLMMWMLMFSGLFMVVCVNGFIGLLVSG